MPWSDWQDGSIDSRNWGRSAILETRDDDGWELTGLEGVVGAIAWDPFGGGIPPSGNLSGGSDADPPNGQRYWSYQVTAPDPSTWEHDLNWFPDLLEDLEYGVDYAERPDRTDSDEDLYVEYESDTTTFVDNLPPAIRLAFQTTTDPWRLGMEPDSAYVPIGTRPMNGATFTGDLSDVLPVTNPSGAIFASGDGSTAISTDFSGFVPTIPQAVAAVTFYVEADFGSSVQVEFTLGNPRVRYQLPRWRYWIPGDSWVKLKNRGDGLGMSTKRLRGRGTSNQAGRLRGSY